MRMQREGRCELHNEEEEVYFPLYIFHFELESKSVWIKHSLWQHLWLWVWELCSVEILNDITNIGIRPADILLLADIKYKNILFIWALTIVCIMKNLLIWSRHFFSQAENANSNLNYMCNMIIWFVWVYYLF